MYSEIYQSADTVIFFSGGRMSKQSDIKTANVKTRVGKRSAAKYLGI